MIRIAHASMNQGTAHASASVPFSDQVGTLFSNQPNTGSTLRQNNSDQGTHLAIPAKSPAVGIRQCFEGKLAPFITDFNWNNVSMHMGITMMVKLVCHHSTAAALVIAENVRGFSSA